VGLKRTDEFRKDAVSIALTSTGIMTSEEGIFAVQSDRPDCALNGIIVHLDAAVCQKQTQSIPVFCDVFKRFAQRGLG